jgi:hypothetical protein
VINPPPRGLLREKVDDLINCAAVRKLADLDFDTLLFGDGTSILVAPSRLGALTATFPGTGPER